MRTPLILATLAVAFTTGCVVYDHDGNGCRWEEDCLNQETGDPCDDANQDGTPDCDEEEAIPVELSMSPSIAEQGETFPAVITLDRGDFDLALVDEAVLFGDIEVLSAHATYDRMILVLQVAEDAEPGPVDIALDAGDAGQVLDAALTIYEAGSGNSALDWADGTDDDCE